MQLTVMKLPVDEGSLIATPDPLPIIVIIYLAAAD